MTVMSVSTSELMDVSNSQKPHTVLQYLEFYQLPTSFAE